MPTRKGKRKMPFEEPAKTLKTQASNLQLPRTDFDSAPHGYGAALFPTCQSQTTNPLSLAGLAIPLSLITPASSDPAAPAALDPSNRWLFPCLSQAQHSAPPPSPAPPPPDRC